MEIGSVERRYNYGRIVRKEKQNDDQKQDRQEKKQHAEKLPRPDRIIDEFV